MENKIDYKKRKARARKFREELVRRPTLSELKFKKILEEMGVPYKFQKRIFTDKGFYIADFYLVKPRIIFEIDGGVHIDRFDKDENREEEILKTKKIRFIVNFPNEFIDKNEDIVKQEIQNIIDKKGEFYEGLISHKSKLLSRLVQEKRNNYFKFL